MAEVTRLFCARCNQERVYQKDRRVTNTDQVADILPFSPIDQRNQADRRKVKKRRVTELFSPGMVDQRKSRGRRPFDGYAWFEGCIEDAVKERWVVREVDDLVSVALKIVLCPECSDKV